MAAKTWIIVCTVLVGAGWLFSAVGQLHGLAYKSATGLALFLPLVLLRKARPNGRMLLRRFRRPLPMGFALLCLVAALGGILHAPNNYDALSYRMPRLLVWLGAGHWTWISTTSQRLNYSAANFEWLSAPLVLLSNSDRCLFLLNLIPFLLLPGLIFSVYRKLGVSPRVAWAWMWVLPAAFCFALQAASIGNDLIGAVFVLASLHFSLSARTTGNVGQVWLALLAIALASGLKGSNLPLLLPALLALWPSRRLVSRRPFSSTCFVTIALLVSYLPTAILNHHFTGDWKGDPHNTEALQLGSPLAGILGNSVQLGAQNLQPPVLPGAITLNRRLTSLIPSGMRLFLKREFPRFEVQMGELPQEESTGLGLPLVALCAVCFFLRVRARRTSQHTMTTRKSFVQFIPWAAATAVLAYMVMIGSEAAARLLTPYYLLLLPILLVAPANANWMRKRWWQSIACFAQGSAILVLLVSPARPLLPAQKIFAELRTRWPLNAQVARAEQVYVVYGARHDVLGPLRDALPVDAARIAVIADDNDLDYALWRPFGVRTLVYPVGTRPWEEETRGFTWIVGKTSLLKGRYGRSLDQLLLPTGAEILTRERITTRVSVGPEEWFVVRLPAYPKK